MVCCRADRYFGSFPKIGIVIPNAAVWLLPEFQVCVLMLIIRKGSEGPRPGSARQPRLQQLPIQCYRKSCPEHACGVLAQEVANALEQTLDLPSILPHGARLDPTADGFLIQLPTCEISLLCTSHMHWHAEAFTCWQTCDLLHLWRRLQQGCVMKPLPCHRSNSLPAKEQTLTNEAILYVVVQSSQVRFRSLEFAMASRSGRRLAMTLALAS